MNITYMLLILGSPEINNIVNITISIVKSAIIRLLCSNGLH